MKSNDMKMTVQQARQEARQKMVEALKNNDSEAYSEAFDQMFEAIAQGVREEYDQKLDDMRESRDTQVLAARGVRQLTSKERDYYQKLAECMKAADVKQALVNADLAMPKTIMNAVFDELQTSHPLLSHIQFLPTGGVVEMLMSQNGQQSALWGKLCDPIVQELLAGFTVVDMTLKKLSAFIPVCKAMLELGPEWLDSFVRQVLYEALANGLEVGIVAGDGKDGPIGMNRQVGEGVSVRDGAYPEKSQIEVDSFDPATIGNLLSMLAVDPAGKPRTLRDVVLIVNPQDYYQLVMPATTIMGGDGTYRNNILPYSRLSDKEKQGLLDGFGVSPMQDDGGYINVKLGFDGYNGVKTKKYPKGQPNALIARVTESGSSYREKTPFIRPAVNASKKQAEQAGQMKIDEKIAAIPQK